MHCWTFSSDLTCYLGVIRSPFFGFFGIEPDIRFGEYGKPEPVETRPVRFQPVWPVSVWFFRFGRFV